MRSAIEYLCERCHAEGTVTFLQGDINIHFLLENIAIQSTLDILDLQNMVKASTCLKIRESLHLLMQCLTDCPIRSVSWKVLSICISDRRSITLGTIRLHDPVKAKNEIMQVIW